MLSGALMNKRSICSSFMDTGCSIPGHSLTAGTGTMVFLGSCCLDSASRSWQSSRAPSSMNLASGIHVRRSKTLLGSAFTHRTAFERPSRRAVVPLEVITLVLTSGSRKIPNANRLMRDPRDSKLTEASSFSHSFCLAAASAEASSSSGGAFLASSACASGVRPSDPRFAITGGRQWELFGRRWLDRILSPSNTNRILAPSLREASQRQPEARASCAKICLSSPTTSVVNFPFASRNGSRATCL
mmetsp:Transcript_51768/g.150312  ORF Transcript_51768/g.150312 Transcript_51768/m.150312 type:complete len:244 (-) Transcript_51768:152-883(-)